MKMTQKILSLALFLLVAVTMSAQTVPLITGTVFDSEGETAIGAAVKVSGTGNTAMTDVDGKFSLRNVAAGSTVEVSYVGYSTSEFKVSATQTDYTVTLQAKNEILDDVVVVGYGTSRRSELTGSITSVKGSDVRDFSVNSVSDALAGRAAGVSVTKHGGSPGETPDIIIRGAASINGIAPLYIVDGVKMGTGFDFNTRDIESIEVLKDAGSCAIYGSEAAGGVILVTTKRGNESKPSLNVNARFGIRNVDKSRLRLLNRDQFIAARMLMGTDILAAEGVDDPSVLPDVDWMDVMYKTAHEQEYNLALSGGNNSLKYYVSAGYVDEEGTYLDSKARRFSIRTNVDYNINKIFSVGTSTTGSVFDVNPTRTYSVYTNSIPFRTVPTMTPVDEDGKYSPTPVYINGTNPYGEEMTYHVNGKNYAANMLGYLTVRFIPELTLHVNGIAKLGAYSRRKFAEEFEFRSGHESASFESDAGTSLELTYNATLTYEDCFADKFNLKLMAGSEANNYNSYGNWVRAIDFPVDVVNSMNLSTNVNKTATDNIGKSHSMSFFGRLNFNYDHRYYLTAVVRRDGSDRFGRNNRWGTFPSVNGMWRMGQESFIRDNVKWLNDVKIRAGYGVLGNDGIGQFLYTRSFSGDQIKYSFDGKEVTGWANFKVPNEDIKWEEVHQLDLGVDFSLFSNRLSLTYDFYDRQTRDMLYWRKMPYASGIGNYWNGQPSMPVNVGKVQNIGHELTINWIDRVADFNYSVGFNASWNSNKILDLGVAGAEPIMDGINRTENGHPMAQLWGYRCLGIIQSQEQIDALNAKAVAAGKPYYWRENTGVGDLLFDDHGQGYIDDNCKEYIGNPWPKMTMGLNLAAQWRGFDLTANFQGAFGFDIYNGLKQKTQTFSDDGNTTLDIYKNSFFGDNGLTDQPRCGMFGDDGQWMGDPSANFGTVSSFWVEKGDYLKLKNFVVGYTLPAKITRKACFNKVRLYFSASNLFTITRYSGIDPEIAGVSNQNDNATWSVVNGSNAGKGVLARGVDNEKRYLPSRLFSFGIDITF